jgi:hypothetical protein
MNRFWLKISGLVVVAAIIIAGVYILWSAKSRKIERIPQQGSATFNSKRGTGQPPLEKAFMMAQRTSSRTGEFENQRAAELRQTAAALRALYRDPNSPEAAKARELFLKVPKGVEEQYGAVQRKRNLPFLNNRGDVYSFGLGYASTSGIHDRKRG